VTILRSVYLSSICSIVEVVTLQVVDFGIIFFVLTSSLWHVLILLVSILHVHQMHFGISYMTLLAPYTLHLWKFVTNSQRVQKLWNHLHFDSIPHQCAKIVHFLQHIRYATKLICANLGVVTYSKWVTNMDEILFIHFRFLTYHSLTIVQRYSSSFVSRWFLAVSLPPLKSEVEWADSLSSARRSIDCCHANRSFSVCTIDSGTHNTCNNYTRSAVVEFQSDTNKVTRFLGVASNPWNWGDESNRLRLLLHTIWK